MTGAVVVDTNVVVAGLISSPGDSPVCRVLDGMLAGTFPFLLSIELLREYRSVLLRDQLRELHGLSPEQVDVVLTEIAANALVREPKADPDLVAPGGHMPQLTQSCCSAAWEQLRARRDRGANRARRWLGVPTL